MNKALFHILPAPLEVSVSYGGGTSSGPAAILESSDQLEIWDGHSIPGDSGIYTHKPVEYDGDINDFLEKLETGIQSVLNKGKIPVILGGEHTVTVSALHALKKTGKDIGIIQFDAHADLRDSYENNRLSHACVLKRAYDLGFQIFQIGTRSLSPEEVKLRENSRRINYIDAEEAVKNNITEITLPENFPETVFITFDIDCLDPSIIPATGTPEPGGLLWYQAISIIESIAGQKEIIGFDLTELAPQHLKNRENESVSISRESEFAAARLVYNIMGIIQRSRKCL